MDFLSKPPSTWTLDQCKQVWRNLERFHDRGLGHSQYKDKFNYKSFNEREVQSIANCIADLICN